MSSESILPEWLRWPEAVAWVQFNEVAVVERIGTMLSQLPIDQFANHAAIVSLVEDGNSRRDDRPSILTVTEAEKSLIGLLASGQVQSRGRSADDLKMENVPSEEWTGAMLHWDDSINVGPARFPAKVSFYDVRVSRDALIASSAVDAVRTGLTVSEDDLAVLPSHATPKHHSCKAAADLAAAKMREGGVFLDRAIRLALDTLGDPRPGERDSNVRAVRDTFNLMYDKAGNPHQN